MKKRKAQKSIQEINEKIKSGEVVVATAEYMVLQDDFETSQGWTTGNLGATSGYWGRGVPVNDPDWSYDPFTDGDGSGSCYLTQNSYGNTDVDAGGVVLNSPVFDLSEGGSISYYYYLLLTNATGGVDKLLVEINSTGGTGDWTQIANHNTNGGLFWYRHTIDQSELEAAGVTFTSQMMVRFIANDADPQSIVEAGVDGFEVVYYECIPPCCGQYTGGITGNTNCDIEGKYNLSDITAEITRVYIDPEIPLCCEENGDVNCDGKLNLSDITVLITKVYLDSEQVLCPCTELP